LGDRMVRNVCMLSTHGYFDPVPELGKTDTGGQVLYVLQLDRSLARLGLKVDIYTRWFDGSKRQIERLPGCPQARVVRIPAGGREFIPKEGIYGVLPELSKNMVQFIKDEDLQYDLFHGHYVDAGMVAMKVAEAFSKPCFFTAHSLGAWKRERVGGDPEEMDRTFNFTRRIAEELRIFRSVNAQTVTSIEEQGKIKELYGFEPPRVEFIPPGVDVHRFRPLYPGEDEETTKIALPEKYIFMVSRIAAAKGHDLLLAAFARVLDEFPDLHVVIAGGTEEPDEEEIEVLSKIERFTKEGGMADRVHTVGGIRHDDLPPYFRRSELFVLPARYEPFGMTALEAMACQVPAVVSTHAGIEENLTSGADCLLVDPLETEVLAEALCSLLRDRDLGKRLGAGGRETVRENFSWQAIAGRYLAFYEKYLVV
jgi:mannosylfructose-phosphate synthase